MASATIIALALLTPAMGLQAPMRRGPKVAPMAAEPDVKVSEATGRQVDMHNYMKNAMDMEREAMPADVEDSD